MPGPSLFLAPCANDLAKENLEATVLTQIPRETYRPHLEEDLGGAVSIWGLKNSLDSRWESISPGDILLFYVGNGRYRYAAEVLDTAQNTDLAAELWPNYRSMGEDAEPWGNLIVLHGVGKYNIPGATVAEFAGYSHNHVQAFQPLNDDGHDAIEAEYGSVGAFLAEHRVNPAIWVEKTSVAGRAYKESGELAVGAALISPKRDKGGGDRYAAMRDIAIGDRVVHLVQDDDPAIVGHSTVVGALDTAFEGPPDADERWNETQQEAGGYRRELGNYRELDAPVDVYDDLLSVAEYREPLVAAWEEAEKLFYTSKLTLTQGAYLTRCPEAVVSVLASASSELEAALPQQDVEEPPNLDDFARGAEPDEPPTYQSIDEAVADVRAKLDDPVSDWPVVPDLLGIVLADWTDVLARISVQNEVDGETAETLASIVEVYQNAEDELETVAQEMAVGTLYALEPSETLFTAIIPILQEEIAELRANANHVKLKTILREEYTVDAAVAESPYPIATYLAAEDDASGWLLTRAPADWIEAIGRRVLAVEEDSVEPGDVVVLHARDDESDAVIGVAVVGDQLETEESILPDGDGATVAVRRLFVTGQSEVLDPNRDRTDKDAATIETETAALLNHRIDLGDVGLEQSETPLTPVDPGRLATAIDRFASDLEEIAPVNVAYEPPISLDRSLLDGLHFPDGRGMSILDDLETAINAGKHVVLTGPPGTGKTELARRVTDHLAAAYPHLYTGRELTTATADWSTFDTVGGYMPALEDVDDAELAFTPGIVLHRLKSNEGLQANEPLVIDELNRADIDKAFGQLFTLLSGQSVTLPYTDDGNEIELLTGERRSQRPADHEYVVPAAWRIVATMNTYDKASLYEMSYAFMRRFAFVRVGAPALPAPTEGTSQLLPMMDAYLDAWSLDIDGAVIQSVASIWQHANHAIEERTLGPAIVHDIFRFVDTHPDGATTRVLTQAVVSYVFPQLEGVRNRHKVVEALVASGELDERYLRTEAQEMLGVPLGDQQ